MTVAPALWSIRAPDSPDRLILGHRSVRL